VVGQLEDERGLVRAGAGGDPALAGDQHESGDGAVVVLDAVGEHGEPEVLRRERRAHGGAAARLVRVGGGEVAGGGRGRGRGGDVRAGHVLAQPSLDLRLGVRVGGDGGQRVEGGVLARREHEADLHGLLGDDGDGGGRGEDVQRAGDPALDGALDRCHEGVDLAGQQLGGGRGDGGEGHQRRGGRGGRLGERRGGLPGRLVGGGGLGAEETVPPGGKRSAQARGRGPSAMQ